jgi:hypothetical protein
MANLKQSTAYTRAFLMVLSSDHITGATGLTVAVTLSKAGGAFATAGGTVTEIANGWYKVALTTTDTGTLGDLAFHCTSATADPTDFVDQVTGNILGDTLPVNVTQWNGTNVVVPATAGVPDVNVKNVNNVSTSSVTTVNANQGTTQPVNFTGTGGLALVQSDTRDFLGHAVVLDANNLPQVDVQDILGLASVGAAGFVGIDWAHINAPTTVQALTNTTISSTQVVASVTGNVGGNVVGSVGSVVAGVNVTQWNSVAVFTSIPPDAVMIRSGTAQGGGASTITLDSGASATNNLYQNQIVTITGGTGAGQSAIVTSYVGSTKVATIVGTWAVNPDATSHFVLESYGSVTATVSGGVNVTQWLGTAVTAATAGVPDVNVKNVNNVSTSAVTTVNANQGTTQPVNFTGTGASALVNATATISGGVNVTQWGGVSVPTPNVGGVPIVDLQYIRGTPAYAFDGTVASATATTVTLPSTDVAGNAIPDLKQYQYCALQIVGGTGVGQVVLLTTATGTARQYNVLAGTMPTQLDSTSQYDVLEAWQTNSSAIGGATFQSGSVDTTTFPSSTFQFETSFTTNFDTFTNQALYFTSGALKGLTARIISYGYTSNNKVQLTTNTLPSAPSNGDAFQVLGKIDS